MASNVRVSTARLREMYEVQFMGTEQIAAALNVSKGTAYYWLVKAGVKMRKQGRRVEETRNSPLTLARVVEVYVKKGLAIRSAAKELGVSRAALQRFMVRHNIRRRRGLCSEFAESQYELVVNEAELVSDYNNGMIVEKCARWHGVSHTTARKILRKHNVAMRNRWSKRPTKGTCVSSNSAVKAA